MDNEQGVKMSDHIWDEDALLSFNNTFSSTEGKDTLVNILFELGFFDDKVGRDVKGNVTLESAIEGAARRNYATTLLRRLALNDEDIFSSMITGLLKGAN
jgi:hypothetical protein